MGAGARPATVKFATPAAMYTGKAAQRQCFTYSAVCGWRSWVRWLRIVVRHRARGTGWQHRGQAALSAGWSRTACRCRRSSRMQWPPASTREP